MPSWSATLTTPWYAPCLLFLPFRLLTRDQYPILESAITGRLNMSDASNEPDPNVSSRHATHGRCSACQAPPCNGGKGRIGHVNIRTVADSTQVDLKTNF
jgi:hypothetical protein